MSDPEVRRALRNLAMIVVVFVLLYFVWSWAERLDSDGLREVLRWALGIIALFAVSVGMENGIRAFKLAFGKDGLTFESSSESES